MQLPFGPFLSAGALVYVFFGDPIIDWYFLWAVF
jgi:leader peptidase (prepilin peptidase)/N-methyltransferase